MNSVFTQVKDRCDVRAVLELYGRVPNSAGMVNCPFHGKDEHPSMRVYKDGLYCFSCGWHGDAIAFVERMDSCSALEAAKKINDVFLLGVSFEMSMSAQDQGLWRRLRKIKSAERAYDALGDELLRADIDGDHEKYQQLARQRDALDAEITRLENEPDQFSGADHPAIPEEYTWDSTGIFYVFNPPKGSPIVEYVCRTAIQIIGVYSDEDTGLHSVALQFHDGMRSRHKTFDRQMLTDPQTVKRLSGCGITIMSAKHLALAFAMRLHNCPVTPSASRFGWFGSEFVPYSSAIHCMAKDNTTETMLAAMHSCKGFGESWLSTAIPAMQTSRAARFSISASLCAPLLMRIKNTGFGVHLYSKTGTGKTVCLLLAASIWGEPQELMKSMGSTAVGMEKTAALLSNIPLIFDELQAAKNKEAFETIVYMLSNGRSKTRGTKDGGNADESRWLSVFLTSGEQAILDDNACTGAVNRVISVDTAEETYGATHGKALVLSLLEHHGHIGRQWIAYIQDPIHADAIKNRATEIHELYKNNGFLDKQLMSGALLQAVSEAAARVLFHDDTVRLTENDILPCLITSEESDKEKKGVEFIKGWIAGNARNFENGGAEFQPREVFGKWQDNDCWIISNKFHDVLKKAGFSPKDVFAEAVRMGVSEWQTGGNCRRKDRSVRVNGKPVRCVLIRFADQNQNICSDGELPF